MLASSSRSAKPQLEIPASVVRRIEATTGAPIVGRHFCGHEHAQSDVWRFELASGQAVVLKRHRHPRTFRQELVAYRHWCVHLPASPALLDVIEEPGAPPGLLLEALAATPAAELALDTHEARVVHRQAGALLRALHALPFRDDDPVPLERALVARVASWAQRARPYVAPRTLAAILAALGDASLFRGAKRVPCHRDFTPRNWLVTGQGEGLRVSVIDFEHARADLWLVDLARLAGEVWPLAPDLREAFLEGYGAALDADDEARLALMVELHGLATVGWAAAHGDGAFERAGRALLERFAGR